MSNTQQFSNVPPHEIRCYSLRLIEYALGKHNRCIESRFYKVI